MDTKSQLKKVQALKIKKYRKEYGEFVVEGEKILKEAIDSDFLISDLFLSDKAIERIGKNADKKDINITHVSQKWLERAGHLQSNDFGLAILKIPDTSLDRNIQDEWIIGLDGISDPGNFGTILRTAEWYGIKNILCSEDCVDLYNPKTLMASKGSFLRINVEYANLAQFLKNFKAEIYSADMEGENIHHLKSLDKKGLLLLGNESNGISDYLNQFVNKKIHISGIGEAESLNVGIANAIILDNFKRLGAF